MNLLIIEDDIFLANKIKQIFEKKIISNRVNILSTFNDFINELYLINTYDVILVDILLWPKSLNNWIDIIRKIRLKNINIPIIIISWLNDIWWLKVAFEKWASDYICKPFRLAELEIRVSKWFNKFLLNSNNNNKTFIEYYWLVYYFNKNIFKFNWNEVVLTKTNKYILLLFISKNEQLLKNIYLIEKIWWDSNLIERNLRVTISRLKKSLNPSWINNWIKNIRWEWYMLKK